MSRITNFQGNPLTLVGRAIRIGIIAPEFRVIKQDLKEARLSDFKNKIKIINSFPSLDTPVCDLQVKEFNKNASVFSSDIVVLGISKDLPFAQTMFCSLNEIKNEAVFSDYKYSSFGINYGLLIKELNLLARAVIIIDKSDCIRYVQIVNEITTAINYKEALDKLQEVINNPIQDIKISIPSHCKPCEEGALALPKDQVNKLIAQYRGWQLVEDKRIVKEFVFKDFTEAKYFLDLVSVIAEEQMHHPSFSLIYNKLKISLYTHAAGGLTDNDFIVAKIIDELGT